LKFNQPFEKGIGLMPNAAGITPPNWIAPHAPPLLARFLGKIVLDVMPAALASVIGGFLFTQYQFGHAAAPRPTAEQVTSASAEMIQMVRDEHAMLIDYLKSQSAAEQGRQVAEDEASARAAADAKAALDAKTAADAKALSDKALSEKALAEAATRRLAGIAAPKPAAARAKAPTAVAAAAATPQAPLVIAQAETDGLAPGERLARDPDSLLAKTLDLKDHVVAATRHVVSAIGDIFASVGERIGGTKANTDAPGRQFSSAS
jgi:hypothetical protein